jgi:hypothetical protein
MTAPSERQNSRTLLLEYFNRYPGCRVTNEMHNSRPQVNWYWDPVFFRRLHEMHSYEEHVVSELGRIHVQWDNLPTIRAHRSGIFERASGNYYVNEKLGARKPARRLGLDPRHLSLLIQFTPYCPLAKFQVPLSRKVLGGVKIEREIREASIRKEGENFAFPICFNSDNLSVLTTELRHNLEQSATEGARLLHVQ